MDRAAWEEKLREYDERTFADWMDIGMEIEEDECDDA